MNAKQKNSLLAAGILSGFLSLPMTWLTVHNPQMDGEAGRLFGSAFSGMSFPVTALNGNVTFLINTPLWFIVGVAIVAGAIQLMRYSQMFAIPKLAEWVTAVVGVLWINIPIIVPLFSDKATLGIGWLLGAFCAATPLVCLVAPTPDLKQAENNGEDEASA
jgi:hypothetical protein